MNNIIIFGVLAFSIIGLVVNNSVFAQMPTTQLTEEEIEEYGKDSDGKKLDYNDCPHYDDGIDPSQYDGMTLDELGAITDAVDQRILSIELGLATGDSDDLQEELNCLTAIRAIENAAEARISSEVSGFIEDLQELSDLYSDQQSVNERFERLNEKYGE